jgi:alkylated DNA repair dioxygenase AlkB
MPARTPSPAAELPDGVIYRPDFLSHEEEAGLLRTFAGLPFRPFDFHGYTAKRRIVEYGWEYDFGARQATATDPLPGFLMPLRARAAAFAGVAADAVVEAVVTEYPPGAPIGWHRDVPQFETIIGVSLGASCRMRLKPYGTPGKIVSLVLEPRSLYVIGGPARWRYQHSIPPVPGLRYSITFRTLKARKPGKQAA